MTAHPAAARTIQQLRDFFAIAWTGKPLTTRTGLQRTMRKPEAEARGRPGPGSATLGVVSTATVARKAGALEALAVFAIIMAYIWRWRFTHPKFWLPAVALILLSHVAHHERAPALGFRTKDFGTCVRRFGPALIGLALAMLGTGLWLGTIRPIGFERAIGSFALYLPWGLYQQYLLNGYFLNRFDMALSRHAASILTSVLFCAVHTPNWFLMLVTLVAGYGAVWVYRSHKNLYFLGLAHALIGTLLFVVVPDSVSHRLNVGPGWSVHR